MFGIGVTIAFALRAGEAGAAEPAVKYTVKIEGVKGDLHGVLESVSRLKTFENRPPPTVAGVDFASGVTTVLISGLGGGGRGLYAMDVSAPER